MSLATREDKRSNVQLRETLVDQNLLTTRADGSARFDFGKSSVICSVSGPVEVKLRDEQLDKAFIDVIVRPLVGNPGTKEKMDEFNIRTTFESVIMSGLHPRTQIQMVAQIMNDDGSTLATAINATTVALIDAGIPMDSIVAAVTCCVNQNGDIYVDPTAKEIEGAQSMHTFAFDNVSDNAVFCESTGLFDEDQYFECYNISKSMSKEIFSRIREALRSKLTTDYYTQLGLNQMFYAPSEEGDEKDMQLD